MVDKGLQRVGGRGFLDDSDEDDDLYTIHGIAIGAGDITLGSKSGERKYWTEDVLQDGASTLEGKQIVANHENRDIYSVVGKVTDASYSEEKQGVVYQGVVDEELIAKRISRGWLDVSPRIIHTEGEVTENGLKKPDKIRRFDNLAIVSRGAAPSNEVDAGESEELDVEELQACFDEGPDFEEGELETFTEELQDNINYKQYLYNSPEGAEGAAQGLDCEGFHKHDLDGGTWYMPCENHDKFLANVKEKASENSEEESLDEDEIQENLEEVVEEFGEAVKKEYSSEEMRIASQLSSYSEATKTQCLRVVDLMNPGRKTDVHSFMDVLSKVMKEQEMKKMYEEMQRVNGDGMDEDEDSGESPLNKIFN